MTETSLAAQEPSSAACVERHSALPWTDCEDMPEAFSVGLNVVLGDRDLTGIARDVVHAHADVSLLLQASQPCRVDHCQYDQVCRVDHDHGTRRDGLQDCEIDCE